MSYSSFFAGAVVAGLLTFYFTALWAWNKGWISACEEMRPYVDFLAESNRDKDREIEDLKARLDPSRARR